MAEMMEIYKKHAANYDELVNAEDYENNLNKFLLKEIDWKDKTVYEAGIGTGRVTQIYINDVKKCYGFDREQHMLDKCHENLINFEKKIQLKTGINTILKPAETSSDLFIEGWSFGHTMNENKNQYKEIFKSMYEQITQLLNPQGKIIIMETMGTNVEEPSGKIGVLEEFYDLLEKEYGFKRYVLRTDYKYPDYMEAARIMGFFFGDEMKNDILTNKKTIIKEFTGIWIKQF